MIRGSLRAMFGAISKTRSARRSRISPVQVGHRGIFLRAGFEGIIETTGPGSPMEWWRGRRLFNSTVDLSSLAGLSASSPHHPAMNRWAIAFRPAGLSREMLRRRVHAPSMKAHPMGVPTGTAGNSPPFQRWVANDEMDSSPARGERGRSSNGKRQALFQFIIHG